MRRYLLTGSIILLLALPAACSEKSETVPKETDRGMAPEIAGEDLHGGSWRLEDQTGKVVLIDFWATWCGPCRRTIPHLIELQAELGPLGLQVVGISLDRADKGAVEAFAQQMGINYPILLDPTGRIARLYGGVESIPTFFLVDRSGKTVRRIVGAVAKGEIEKALEPLLGEG